MNQGQHFASTGSPIVDLDRLCQKIRAAFEPTRARAVSMYDECGNLLWLSENSMGPDEHNAVRAAFEIFASGATPAALAFDLGDTLSAVMFHVANANRETAGAVMTIIDTRAITQHAHGAVDLLTPGLQRVLSEFAALRQRTQTKLQPAASPVAAVERNRAREIVSPEVDRVNEVLRRTPIELHVQQLVPLNPGSKRKRYEVLLRSKLGLAQNAAPNSLLKTAIANGLGSMIDRRVVTELVTWLVRHPTVWETHGAMFSVNLTRTALHDEHFMKFVELCLAKASLARETIAFEIDVPTAIKQSTKIAEFAASLHRLGCPLVLDDFTPRTECFDLLRLPGICLIKMASDVTSRSRADRNAAAAVAALVQRSRALGIHTVAKRTKSRADERWLTDLGVDFVQSNAFSMPVTIESLAKQFAATASPI
jgi:EAL domain-containing protein (putative c-di-GMP-specific phosphodiesterase class I)